MLVVLDFGGIPNCPHEFCCNAIVLAQRDGWEIAASGFDRAAILRVSVVRNPG